MKLLKTKQQVHAWRKEQSGPVGFVPTMGYLHEGHAELLKASVKQNDVTVLSIFVNPTQFGPNEDLDRYPRDFERDQALAESLGVDAIFYPSVEEMYNTTTTLSIQPGAMATKLCGASRPGHFDGVLQIVTKLFHIVQPTNAYFGQKDAQQLALIESLVESYDFPLTVHRIPTVREQDGLAKSSRNVFLSNKERKEAAVLFQALQHGKELVESGARTDDVIRSVKAMIETNTSGRVDYVELLSYPNLEVQENAPLSILATAVFFTKARLIDNILIERVNAHA